MGDLGIPRTPGGMGKGDMGGMRGDMGGMGMRGKLPMKSSMANLLAGKGAGQGPGERHTY
jgi:hypothetical protein